MAEAVLEKTNINITVSSAAEKFIARGEVVKKSIVIHLIFCAVPVFSGNRAI